MEIKYLSAASALTCILLGGCAEKSYDYGWIEEIEGEAPECVAEFNSRYAVTLTNAISSRIYSFDGEYELKTTYTEADDSQTKAVADFLEKEVFPLFPDGFIAAYMPWTMYVADSVKFVWTDELMDYDPVAKKDIHRITEKTRNVCGDVGGKQVTFSAKALETADRDSLRFEWTSLLIERMMSNTDVWPKPEKFIKIAEDRLTDYYEMSLFKYYQSTFSKGRTTFGMPFTPFRDRFNLYYYCGAFRTCRYGHELYYRYTGDFAVAGGYGTTGYSAYTYYEMTYQQDFADMLAFLLCYTEREQEEMIQLAASRKTTRESTETASDGTEYTVSKDVVVGREVFEERIALVREYMKTNLKWDI